MGVHSFLPISKLGEKSAGVHNGLCILSLLLLWDECEGLLPMYVMADSWLVSFG